MAQPIKRMILRGDRGGGIDRGQDQAIGLLFGYEQGQAFGCKSAGCGGSARSHGTITAQSPTSTAPPSGVVRGALFDVIHATSSANRVWAVFMLLQAHPRTGLIGDGSVGPGDAVIVAFSGKMLRASRCAALLSRMAYVSVKVMDGLSVRSGTSAASTTHSPIDHVDRGTLTPLLSTASRSCCRSGRV